MASVSNEMATYLLGNFKTLIRGMDGVQPRTKDQYLKVLQTDGVGFLSYVRDNGLNIYSIKQYKVFLSEQSNSNDTKNNYLSAAKALIKELQEVAPLAMLVKLQYKNFPVRTGHRKEGLTLNEVFKVKEEILRIEKEEKRLKIYALFCLMAWDGLRQMEAANLTIEKTSLQDGFILVEGKGGADVKLNLMGDTIKALAEWVEFKNVSKGFIFASPRTGRAITEVAIRKIFGGDWRYKDGEKIRVEGIFEKAGVKGRSVHGFRHFNLTMANNAYGGNITKVSRRGRQKSIQTTINYLDGQTDKQDAALLEKHFKGLGLIG